MNEFLSKPIHYLEGLGKEKATLITEEIGLKTIRDFLFYFPFRYVDKSEVYSPHQAFEFQNQEIQVVGELAPLRVEGTGKSKRYHAQLFDGQNELNLVWFRMPSFLKESLLKLVGQQVVAYGKIGKFGAQPNIAHPEITAYAAFKKSHQPLLPIYSLTEKLQKKGVNQRFLQKIQLQISQHPSPHIENLPTEILQHYGFPDRNFALRQIHYPHALETVAEVTKRLKFEELFFMQCSILTAKRKRKLVIRSHSFPKLGDFFHRFYKENLAFELTQAQKRVLREIRHDLAQENQMNRLLQGDVGSGKTVVALISMLMAADNGYQSLLLAPTEILAQQHFQGISEMLKNLGVRLHLLTGSTRAKERKIIHTELESGVCNIIIGTHALLEEKVKFHNLGLAIIDEQHKFGVAQRARLWKKNEKPPHILVMTATPIPRTLALTQYGDLSLSVIDELPKGRKPIQTKHFTDSQRLAVFGFMKRMVEAGKQVYVVYPLIEESKNMDYKDLFDGYESICRYFPLPKYAVAVVHGRMKADAKEFEMQRFVRGEAQILVATTVIEVGVNVPNASVMVIESAEKFGLSQLHQLRGRVGRGSEQSYCLLMTDNQLSATAKKRIQIMVETTDGFRIAEEDLQLRGFGNLMGTQQSGEIQTKISNLSQDHVWVEHTREWAKRILAKDPELKSEAYKMVGHYFFTHHASDWAWSFIG